MDNTLKTYHKLLPILIVPICLVGFVVFGWSAYSTITERPGLNGDQYMYFNLTRLQFSIYAGIVSFAGLCFAVLIPFNVIQPNQRRITKLFWLFLLCMGLVIVSEIYLQSRFVGKG